LDLHLESQAEKQAMSGKDGLQPHDDDGHADGGGESSSNITTPVTIHSVPPIVSPSSVESTTSTETIRPAAGNSRPLNHCRMADCVCCSRLDIHSNSGRTSHVLEQQQPHHGH
jgi:hypothetical protein